MEKSISIELTTSIDEILFPLHTYYVYICYILYIICLRIYIRLCICTYIIYMFVYTLTLICQLYIVNNNNNNNSNNSLLQVNFINPKTTRKHLSKVFIKRSEKQVYYLEDLVFLNLNIKALLTTFSTLCNHRTVSYKMFYKSFRNQRQIVNNFCKTLHLRRLTGL